MEQKNDEPTFSRKAMNRVSKSGRQIKTPKAILTTSSDEAPPRRRSSKTAISVKTELQRLRNIAKNITASKHKTLDKTLNKTSAETLNRTRAETLNKTVDKSSNKTSAEMLNKTLDKTANETCAKTLNKTLDTTANETCAKTLNKTCAETLNRTLDETANETCAKTLNKTCAETLNKTCAETLNRTLDKTANETCAKTLNKTCAETLNRTLDKTANKTFAETLTKTGAGTLNKTLDRTHHRTSAKTLNKTLDKTSNKIYAETSNETSCAETSYKTSDGVFKTVPIESENSIRANIIETSIPKRKRFSCSLSKQNNEDDADESGPVNHSKIDLEQVLENLRVIQQQNVIVQQQNTDIQQQNEKMLQELKLMFSELKQKNASDEITAKLYKRLEGFPLQTVEEFKKIETDEEKNQRKKLYHHLSNLGESRVREFLSCALKETMTDELVNKFTWPGGQHSEKLGDTKIANVLYLAAKNCPLFRGPDTKTEFKSELQEVLRATKQRYRKLCRKSLQPEKLQDREEPTVADEVDILERIRQLEEELVNDSSEDEPFQEHMDVEGDVDTDNY